nr:hypothetical protein [Escherichia coli]
MQHYLPPFNLFNKLQIATFSKDTTDFHTISPTSTFSAKVVNGHSIQLTC